LHLEGAVVLIVSLLSYHRSQGLKYPARFKDTHLNPLRQTSILYSQ
jgi:hypothetical protein